MKDELVPEMHDLFKLTKYGHLDTNEKLEDFQTFKDYIPDNKTWQGIIGHHFFDENPNYPTTPEVFILSIADHLASGISRESEQRTGNVYNVYKLWNPPEQNIDPRLQNDSDIIELLEFANKNPTGEDFLNKYKDLLKIRTEDAGKGKNISSLYTHSLLTGKFYRILKNSPTYSINEKDLCKNKSEVKSLQKRKENQEWQMYVIRCKVKFKQKPLRTKDLNIFSTIYQLFNDLKETCADNIFFISSDELIMFFPDKSEALREIESLLNFGFYLEIAGVSRPLEEITKPSSVTKHQRKENIWPPLPEYINPPICQICQMVSATKHWPIDYILETKKVCDNCRKILSELSLEEAFMHLCEEDGQKLWDITEDTATEDLCENCYKIRAQGVRLLKLRNWTEAGDTKVVWLKLSLDFDHLNDTLNNLYQEYLNELGIIDKDAQIRFPVISEFQEDYKDFVGNLKQDITRFFTKENVEIVSDELMCIKIEKLSEMLKVLEIYNNLIDKYFPKFKDKDISQSPIRITLVASNSKYPFFEVWDIMENAQDDILVALINRGMMKVRLCNIDTIVKAYQQGYKFQKSALEKLARVAEISEKLAQLTAQDKSDKDYQTYEQMTHLGLDFKSLLTFAKIMED
ncbi:MAG: hypothetical protein ABIK19_02205 [candidate division WOR-3 bacterium]